MDEEQLRPLFEQAGPIAHIMVIRDRQTDAHRGESFMQQSLRFDRQSRVQGGLQNRLYYYNNNCSSAKKNTSL